MDDKELVVWKRIRDKLRENAFTNTPTLAESFIPAMVDRIEALTAKAEALRKLERGDIPRPVGSAWFPDGRASKHDRCVHDVWMYEACEGCQDAFIAAALKAWE